MASSDDSPPENSRPWPSVAAAPAEEAPRTAYDLKSIGLFSGKITRPLLQRRGLAEGDLLAHWVAIVGNLLSQLSQPEQIRFPPGRRDGGELTLRVSSGAAAIQIQHNAPKIIERLNSYYGYPVIRAIKLMQAPIPPRRIVRAPQIRPLSPREEKSLEETLEGVTDPQLRQALEGLGRSMMGRKAGSRKTQGK